MRFQYDDKIFQFEVRYLVIILVTVDFRQTRQRICIRFCHKIIISPLESQWLIYKTNGDKTEIMRVVKSAISAIVIQMSR